VVDHERQREADRAAQAAPPDDNSCFPIAPKANAADDGVEYEDRKAARDEDARIEEQPNGAAPPLLRVPEDAIQGAKLVPGDEKDDCVEHPRNDLVKFVHCVHNL
jgi:hypothetical protein